MPSSAPGTNDERVLIVPPTRRDGEVTVALLGQVGVACVVCPDLAAMVAELQVGVGALMLTERALLDAQMRAVLDLLDEQPTWSDVPVLMLTRDRTDSPAALRVLAMMNNVTVMDRPASTRSLVSGVQAALRARRRQYQIRDHLILQQRAEQALLDADQRKNQFLATLAHELRNPLAPIRTGMEVLARVPGEGEQATRVREMMERQLGQLVKLIDDLLDVSRISTGKIVLRNERVDMRDVVNAALEASQPATDAAHHEVRVHLPGEPLWVVGDPSRLAQVVGNLLNNAAKYTPNGGVISLRLWAEGGDAAVRVTDSGVGIPPAMLESIFDMFTQVNRTLDRAQGGLGIGLSLVRRLMALHGGSAVAHSQGLGMGCAVTVRLPALDAPATAPAPEPAPSTAAPHQARVLVVDDNADAAETLSLLLQVHGHRTRTEYDAVAALQAAAEFEPDAIFCDIGMPGMNGHELATRLRADERHARTLLIAVTGWGSEEDKRRTETAGFDFHLTKPVNFQAVEDILARLQPRDAAGIDGPHW